METSKLQNFSIKYSSIGPNPYDENNDMIMLDKWRNCLPKDNGIYVFSCTEKKFPYPKGESGIYYIGKAKLLRNRLMHKLRSDIRAIKKETIEIENNKIYPYPYLNIYTRYESKVSFIKLQDEREASLLESQFILAFYLQYLTLPFGNRTGPKVGNNINLDQIEYYLSVLKEIEEKNEYLKPLK